MTIIRAIDFETTGIPTPEDKHAIVEIGACDLVMPENGPAVLSTTFSVLCDPMRAIPYEAMAVHHITDAMVIGATGSLKDLGEPDYFVAHNADYERQFFDTPIPVICTWKVALRLWPDLPAHNLQFLRYALALEVDIESCQPPHRAGPDAYLCAVLMKRILAEGRCTLVDMVRWSNGPALLPRMPAGKHKGSAWADIPSDYLEWVIGPKCEMGPDIKANARHHLKQRAAA